MQGNSLVESWRGHDLSHLVDQKRKGQLILFETLSDVHRKKLRDLLHKWYSCSDHRERARLRANIRAAAEEQISSVFPDFSFGDLDPSANPEFFLWHLWFAEVFDKGGFDVVIGNPPYVSNMDEETKQYLRKNYEASSYLLDLYIAFIEKSQKLLSKGGMLCFITPNSWMKNLVQAPIRKFVLENLCIKKIVPKITNAFDSANVETSILLARNENRIGDFEVISYQGDTFPFSHTSSTKQFLQNEGLVFDVFTDEITRCILAKMRKGAKPVEALFNIIRGIGPYKVGSAGQTEEIVKSRAYHATYAKDETFVPQLRGKHVKTFSYQWDGKDYISYGKWLSEPRDPSVFEGYRLIFREILGERLVCTFISETFKMDRSLYIAKPKDGSSETCKYVLGVLASKAMIFYFKNSSNEFDELFPKIRVAEFRKLPIPSATATQQAEIAGLVERVLALKGGGVDTSALEAQIDALVYRLYGLTPEEIAVVEERE